MNGDDDAPPRSRDTLPTRFAIRYIHPGSPESHTMHSIAVTELESHHRLAVESERYGSVN